MFMYDQWVDEINEVVNYYEMNKCYMQLGDVYKQIADIYYEHDQLESKFYHIFSDALVLWQSLLYLLAY